MHGEFTVTTGNFTGPLDLLLELIEKRKVFIGDVSLASVADDFLEHINSMESFPLSSVAQFLVIASTLLLIKSRSLLPHLTLTDEETQDIAELEHRLALYKEIRELSMHIKKRFGVGILFGTNNQTYIEPVFSPHHEITKSNILNAVHELIKDFPTIEDVPHAIVEKVMSLEEMIDKLTMRIQKDINATFSEMSDVKNATNKEKKLNVIISFLAILELVKKGIVGVKQAKSFEDIAIART